MAKTVQKQLFISSMVPRLLVKKHLADRQLDDIAMTVSFGRQVSLLKLAKCRSTKRFLTKRHGTCKMKIKNKKSFRKTGEKEKKVGSLNCRYEKSLFLIGIICFSTYSISRAEPLRH